MRAPLTFAWRNIVFGASTTDAWAVYRLGMCSYAGLPAVEKRELLGALAGFAYGAEADFQLLRVSRGWPVDGYFHAARALLDPRCADPSRFTRHVALHATALSERAVWRPEVYLAVSLQAPELPFGEQAAAAVRERWLALRRLGAHEPRGITQRQLEDLLTREARAFARVGDFLDGDRASTGELQWLIARAFSRGLGEPAIDAAWQPQALVIDGPEEEARRRYVPLESDVLRLMDAPIYVGARQLRVEDELGSSHQAMLVLGALPEVATFPGRQAELLFAPLEALPFPVDAVVSARWLRNDVAIALARRKLVDADNVFAEEEHGEHGASASGTLRPAVARELEEYLTAPERPPLLRACIALAIGAPSPEALEARVQRVRREYAPVVLHRPLGSQLDLFISHLPAQRTRLRGYDDVLVCEQLGAMVPTATHAVGPEVGLYIGRTLSGGCHPVLFDLTEAPRTSRPPAILCSGTLGSGKTVTALLLAYLGYLAGSRVVTVDPKGDHHLDTLIGPQAVERIELRPGAQDRGLLDPLRIGPGDTRADLAYSFLLELLPTPVPPTWQTEIRHAVDDVVARGARSCGDVLGALQAGPADARDAGRAIAVHAGSGLLQLGFAEPGRSLPDPGARAVTCLRIANLTLPIPGTPRAELTFEERAGQALLRLLATYALHLMSGDWSQHKVLVFDEAWMLLGDAAGRALVHRINRLCRSQNATPILATQALADVAELENLIGALFCFGVETDTEARRALELLRMDADDARLRAQLQGFRRGRCFLRDYDGRLAPVHIDPVDPAILQALDTRPGLAA